MFFVVNIEGVTCVNSIRNGGRISVGTISEITMKLGIYGISDSLDGTVAHGHPKGTRMTTFEMDTVMIVAGTVLNWMNITCFTGV